MLKSSVFKLFVSFFVVLLAACQSADDTPPTTPSNPPTATILHQFGQQTSATSGNFEVTQGSNVQFGADVQLAANRSITNYAWNHPAGVLMITDPDPTDGGWTANFKDLGSFTISLVVTDSASASSEKAEVVVTVKSSNGANNPPQTQIQHDNGTGGAIDNLADTINITVGTTVKFNGVVNDPDGDTTTSSWTLNNGSTDTSQTPDANGTVTITFDTETNYTLTLNATDSQGLADPSPDVVTINVSAVGTPLPPTATILNDYDINSRDISILTGTTVSFSASPKDPGYRYAWDFGSLAANTPDTATPAAVTFNTAGSYPIKLTITDTGTNLSSAQQTITVTVTDPAIPDAKIKHDVGNGSGDFSIEAGTTVNFQVLPPVNSAWTYKWTFGGAAADQTGSGPLAIQFATAGTYVVTLTASDASNTPDPTPDQITVTVTPVGSPTFAIVHDAGSGDGSVTRSGDLSITNGDTVVYQVKSSLSNLSNYTFAWDFGGGATNQSGAGPLSVPFTTDGTFTVTLTVTDTATTNTVTDTMTLTVKPRFSIVHDAASGDGNANRSGDLSINNGDTVVYQVSSNLTDVSAYSFNWDFGGGATNLTGAGPLSVPFSTDGTFTVKLTVMDGSSTTVATDQISLTVTTVGTPIFTIVHDNASGDGNITRTGDIRIPSIPQTVVFNYTSSIADTSNYSFVWDSDGPTNVSTDPATGNYTVVFDNVGIYHPNLTVTDTTGTNPTQYISITVTVTDPSLNQVPDGFIAHDMGSGQTGSSGDVRIAAGSTIEFTGTGFDPEQTALTYDWQFIGGSPSTSQTPATTGPSGPIAVSYATPGSYLVVLTVTDAGGQADTSPATMTVTVLPALQTLPVLTPDAADASLYKISVHTGVLVDVVTPSESWQTPMLRYGNNGTAFTLPPVMKVAQGTTLSVNVTNNLADKTTIHWHGLKVDAANDGGPDNLITGTCDDTTVTICTGAATNAAVPVNAYNFTVDQPAAPLWFHPHPDGATATQVYDGLAGALIVTDSDSDALETNNELPSGDHDVALLLQDRSFQAAVNGVRDLDYTPNPMMGMLGDTILVNDTVMPAQHVDNAQYRYRLFNGSNARTYDVAVATRAANGDMTYYNFNIVGSDGGLLESPQSTDHVMLAPGERAEIVVDFSTFNVGDSVLLTSRSFNAGMMGGGMGGVALANGAAFDLMSFELKMAVTDPVTLYTTLPSGFTKLDPATVTAPTNNNNTQMTFELGMTPGAAGAGPTFTINGVSFDPTVVNVAGIPHNATVIWTITNPATAGMGMMAMPHPFHAHAIQWQILDRTQGGSNVPLSGADLGWKDTFLVRPNEVVRIIGKFEAINSGNYMYHCHILEHEDSGMMGMFEVLP